MPFTRIGYPLASALARPLIAKHLVAIARMEGAATVAHGCTGKDNDQVGLDISVRALDPSLELIAPARDWEMSRSDEIEYARVRSIPVPVTIASPYSVDSNLWGRSIECGVLEDAWNEPPEDIYTLTRAAQHCPDEPAYVEIDFDRGVPVRANGIDMALVELIESLETIAGAHGVGRIDMIENRLMGIKSREIYEAPAAVVLHTAHRELEKLVIPRDLERIKQDMGRVYADAVYNGLWFSPTRDAIDAFVAAIQPRVTGTVRLKLFKGDCRVVGRRSEYALYDRELATYDAGDSFDHAAAEGFIKIWGLPTADRRAKQAAHRRRWSADRWHTCGPAGSPADPDAALFEFGASFTFDRRLFDDDVAEAWRGRKRCGRRVCCHRPTLPDSQRARGNRAAGSDIPAFFASEAAAHDEDVHSFVERELVARVGDAGRRLHTGRSRNEQVSLDFRLYLKRRVPQVQHAIADLVRVLSRQAESCGDALMPSYTHLRRAQPVMAAHFFLAHAAAFVVITVASGRCWPRSTSCRSDPARLPGPATRST